jgi:hypothetical protein
MEKKIGVRLEDRLLEARNEGLQNMKETTLRPHGKLWGMDVFSWYKPNIHILANTLHAFPFPVVWIGNRSDIFSTIEEDPSVCIQLNSIIAFDETQLILPSEKLSKIKNIAGVNSLQDAFRLLKYFQKKNAVLLFSASNEDWKKNKLEFEEFLSIHQTL